jgi:hypothetical protein
MDPKYKSSDDDNLECQREALKCFLQVNG